MFQRIWMSFFNPKFALLPICTSKSKLIKYVTVNFLYFLLTCRRTASKIKKINYLKWNSSKRTYKWVGYKFTAQFKGFKARDVFRECD